MNSQAVMITGATSGIGEALFKHYAQRSKTVIPCGRNKEKLSLLSKKSNSEPLNFDVTDADQVRIAASKIEQLDVLILNAGDCIYIDEPCQFDNEAFTHIINVNLISMGHLLKYFLPKVKAGGQVVFISSAATIIPFAKAEAYGASKAGLDYLANSLRVSLTPKDISVSLVHPGFVKTPLTDKNVFDMPFMISPDEAAKRISVGISRRKNYIHFPKRLTYLLRLLALLPHSVRANLLSKRDSV